MTALIRFLLVAIPAVLLLLAVFGPFAYGVLGRPFRGALLIGWISFVGAYLFFDIGSPILASVFLDRETASAYSYDQPGTIAALFSGWLLAGVFYLAGRLVRVIDRLIHRKPLP